MGSGFPIKHSPWCWYYPYVTTLTALDSANCVHSSFSYICFIFGASHKNVDRVRRAMCDPFCTHHLSPANACHRRNIWSVTLCFLTNLVSDWSITYFDIYTGHPLGSVTKNLFSQTHKTFWVWLIRRKLSAWRSRKVYFLVRFRVIRYVHKNIIVS